MKLHESVIGMVLLFTSGWVLGWVTRRSYDEQHHLKMNASYYLQATQNVALCFQGKVDGYWQTAVVWVSNSTDHPISITVPTP